MGPLYGERVPYIVVSDTLETCLKDLIRDPGEALAQASYDFFDATIDINKNYYLRKQVIPALDVILKKTGVSALTWIENMTLPAHPVNRPVRPRGLAGQATLDNFYPTSTCRLCKHSFTSQAQAQAKGNSGSISLVCKDCTKDEKNIQTAMFIAQHWERK